MTAASADETPLALEEGQVAEIGVGDDHDVAPVPTVATVWTPLRHVLLAPEAERAVTAAAPTHLDAGPVVEHARSRRPR
jgi:hypothetical protein